MINAEAKFKLQKTNGKCNQKTEDKVQMCVIVALLILFGQQYGRKYQY